MKIIYFRDCIFGKAGEVKQEQGKQEGLDCEPSLFR